MSLPSSSIPERSPLTGPAREAWLTLAMVPGVGPARLASLLAACSDADGVLGAPFAVLCAIPGVGSLAAGAIVRASRVPARQALSACEAIGGQVLLPGDPEFPSGLLTIPGPPAVLFALGDLRCLPRPAVAIVGSRDHTPYGAQVCATLAALAAASGLVVVSGMARGLDAVAHRAALDAGPGSTIGVLGTGLGQVYPRLNCGLHARVARDGLLLTEFPPGAPATQGNFPRRNRLIAGLARVTVVVEAAVGSGALLTAAAALDQGKDVMAVPGPITSTRSAGCNLLIRDGAHPLLELGRLLDHYPEAEASEPGPGPVGPAGAVLDCLAEGPSHADRLAERLGRPIGDLLSLLGAMEVQGLVVQHPGQVFAPVPGVCRRPAGA